MTSERQRLANRANAANSTGPRTPAGKATSRANARKHGLGTSIWSEPGANVEINQLADAIVRDLGRPDLRMHALQIAEAEFDLRRICRARDRWRVAPPPARFRTKRVMSENARLVAKSMAKATRRKQFSMEAALDIADELGWTPFAPVFVEKPVGNPLKDQTLDILDRYERRALSRLKSAIQAFDIACAEA